MGNALLKGFDKYYNTVTKVGYVTDKTVSQFIVASWIYDVLKGDYGFVEEDQYNLLNDVYVCLEGSCLVPYQKYCKGNIVVNKLPVHHYVRITEIPVDDEYVREHENNYLKSL